MPLYDLVAESHDLLSYYGIHQILISSELTFFSMLCGKNLEQSATRGRRTFRILHMSTDEVYGSLDAMMAAFS